MHFVKVIFLPHSMQPKCCVKQKALSEKCQVKSGVRLTGGHRDDPRHHPWKFLKTSRKPAKNPT